MLTKLESFGEYLEDLSKRTYPWTNVYGLARSLLALGTLLTLVFNDTTILFRPGSGIPDYPLCSGIGNFGIYCLFSQQLDIAKWISITVLLAVLSGWRPRITAIPHWWVSLSLHTSALTLDGGDQVTAVLTFLLLPISLTDDRKWHWSLKKNTIQTIAPFEPFRIILSVITYWVIRFQVSIIYFHAFVAKVSIEEWLDGTILYYWFTDPVVGLPSHLSALSLIL